MDSALKTRLEGIIGSDPVVLFMKGNRQAPRCSFSAKVVQMLDSMVPSYTTIDVLADPDVRDGIKELSSWPTIPQLYVHGKFVGGCDIVTDLYESGELETTLGVDSGTVAEPTVPSVTVKERAAKAFKDALGGPDEHVRLTVSPGYEHDLSIGTPRAGDLVVETGGLSLLVDRMSAARAEGIVIDWIETPDGGAFKIDNPNEPPRVKPIDAAALQARLEKGPLEIFDVRSPSERDLARIEGTKLLDRAAQDYIANLPRSTPLYFHCHSGARSQAAAEHFLQQGFTEVYNLRGGIDAWSREVDASVKRY